MPVVEILFLGMFIFWCYLRAFKPEAYGTEKFMDFGFQVTHLKNGIFACNMDSPVPVLQRQRIAGVEVQELGAENVLVAGADQV